MTARVRIALPPGMHPDARHELARHLAWSQPGIGDWGVEASAAWFDAEPDQLDQEALQAAAAARIKAMDAFPARVVHDLRHHSAPTHADLEEILRTSGAIREVSPGTLALTGSTEILARRIDRWFERYALEAGADAWQFPSLMQTADLARSGYLRDFPHQANLVCHLPGHAQEVIQLARAASQGDSITTPHTTVLAPTVCYRLFRCLADSTLDEDLLLATSACSCFRFEGAEAAFLDRLREFKMRELVAVGTPARVESLRDAMLEATRSFLDEARLHAWMESASDPFFQDVWEKGRLFQLGFDLKTEARVAIAGRPESLAVASVNYHRDHFGLRFGINLPDGTPAHSACVGFGIERWVLAVMSHYGARESDWPEVLRYD